ncbi:MAG: bifunctional chorismate mutase/prephenate dehydratase [Stomatobaculum sp.]|nr:bifunctional chorismate mutase/prephenate dehydratase [Stomatobaculum sp.]
MDLKRARKEACRVELQVERFLRERIGEAIENTPKMFPDRAAVACQGIEGAYSQMACERMFSFPEIRFYKTFEEVFSAVEEGECRYGVLPVENSTAGSVRQVYDLMMTYRFYIVRSVRVKVDHCLLALPGTEKTCIREVVSHEQAIRQCADYLKGLGDVRIAACENTAVAARLVSKSGRSDLAALSSVRCAGLYGLSCLEECVQDQGSNHTRFICISGDLEIYPGSDRSSIMVMASRAPGVLNKLLSCFDSFGTNLLKTEGCPLPEENYNCVYYFDVEKSAAEKNFSGMIGEISGLCERCEYLGSYMELT